MRKKLNTSKMTRTPIKKIGKIGKANKIARKIIAEIAEEKGLNYCELGFAGCKRTMFLAPAHRHFRNFYQGDVKALSDPKNWIVACQSCHSVLDDRSKTTQEESDEIFNRLR